MAKSKKQRAPSRPTPAQKSQPKKWGRKKAPRAPRSKTQRALAQAALNARTKADTRVARLRYAARLRALPRLPRESVIGRRRIFGWWRGKNYGAHTAAGAWVERSRTTPTLIRRLLLLVRRQANLRLASVGSIARCEKIARVGPLPKRRNYQRSDIADGRQVTIRLPGGLPVSELTSNLTAVALAYALQAVADNVGREFWSSHFREIPNVARRIRCFWGIRLTATHNAITPSQGGELIHYTSEPASGTAESISDYDSDPAGEPANALRQGALQRYLGFAQNVAALHPDERALYVRLYVIVPKPRDRVYQLYDQRVRRIKSAGAKKSL